MAREGRGGIAFQEGYEVVWGVSEKKGYGKGRKLRE